MSAIPPDLGSAVRVRPLQAADWPAVRAIYQAGIDTRNATFETVAPEWERWDAGHLADHRFVAVDADDSVLGWVAACGVSDRCVYAGVVEHSVYVDPVAQGRGVGRTLLDALVASTEDAGIWTIQSGIFPENAASLAVHTAVGFRVIGRRERVGRLDGVWRDTLLVERRSTRVGTD